MQARALSVMNESSRFGQWHSWVCFLAGSLGTLSEPISKHQFSHSQNVDDNTRLLYFLGEPTEIR